MIFRIKVAKAVISTKMPMIAISKEPSKMCLTSNQRR